MKNIMAWVMAGVMAICSGNLNLADVSMEDGITESKLSEELAEKMAAGEETYSVMVWLKDIDYDAVNEQVEAVTHNTWSDIEQAENDVYLARGERMAQSMAVQAADSEAQMMFDQQTVTELSEIQVQADAMIMAERQIASETYIRQNVRVVAEYDLQEDVEYVSRYAPAFIANLTSEQILTLCEDEAVDGIDYWQNAEEVVEEPDAAGTMVESATPDTSYLSYIDADKLLYAGLKGTGVKVGLMDASVVEESSHEELNNSDIFSQKVIGAVVNEHSISMARIICGEYGVAPKCKVYSYGSLEVLGSIKAIEDMINKGVTVINYSKGSKREGSAYSYYEKWIDHIAAQHSVTFIQAAGNDKGDVCIPGLAYNAITVANINHITDTIYNSSSYINGIGCEKPDVSAPGANVLMYYGSNKGGTSAATACVTGMVALMMQAKPSLAKSPHVIKAIVIASCDHIAGSSSFGSGYNEKQGAGVINAARAITIISQGQYFGGYCTSNGTILKKNYEVTTSGPHTYVLAGIKMNISTGGHSLEEIDNADMASMAFGVTSSSGNTLGYCSMSNSSVQLVRSSASASKVHFSCNFENICSRGVPYALAWY